MLGQFGGMLFETAGMDFFKRPSHLLVQADAAGGDHLLVEGLAEEGMGKAVADRRPNGGALLDHGHPLRLFEGLERILPQISPATFCSTSSRNSRPMTAAMDSSWLQLFAQARQPLADDISQPLGDTHLQRASPAGPPRPPSRISSLPRPGSGSPPGQTGDCPRSGGGPPRPGPRGPRHG